MKPRLKAELVCTGSELLSAKVNSYTPLFHGKLAAAGIILSREHSCPDDLATISLTLSQALERADLVIACGGLGPTFDDLTRQAAAKTLGLKLVHSKYCEKILKTNYNLAKLPPNFRDQCRVLEGATPVENANGTAFGLIVPVGKKLLVLVPGPRKEWEPMFDGYLLPEIRERFGARAGASAGRRLKIAGLREMEVQKLLAPVMKRFPEADFTVLAGAWTAEFLFTVPGPTTAAAGKKAAALEKACLKLLDGRVYGRGDDTLEAAVGGLLAGRGLTLSLAESCTGGLVSKLVTDRPGSSAYYLGGVNSYSNSAKTALLGVGKTLLKEHGAVSAECAAAMAEGARKAFRSDYALSVTGIAGPDGGTPEKPVGLVWFGLAGPRGVKTFSHKFRGGREHIRLCAANAVLDGLRKVIE